MIMNLLTCFSHIYSGFSSYFLAWHRMLLYFPFCHISPHFSVSKLFGSPISQCHVLADVPLTQAMLPLTQYHVWDLLTLSKPMSQRVFVRFLVKFLTKCHSFSVSIETSEPFSCLRHFSLAALQLIFSSWKVYLEQTVTNVYGKPTDKREKRQTKQNDLFTYLSITEIKIGYTEGELNEKLRHTRKFLHLPWCSGDWVNETEFARLGHYISQKTFEGWHPPSLPLQSHVQIYKGELELCFCIITTNTNTLGVFYKIVYVAIYYMFYATTLMHV